MKKTMPSQAELMLPLLEELDRVGGVAKPGELYDRLAARLRIGEDVRGAECTSKGRSFSAYERAVRWTRQTAVARGLIDASQRGRWALTSKARAHLKEIVRGTILTIFETDKGFVLWANAEDVAGVIERESVQLIWTSPPYCLLRSREYGNHDERSWVTWMLKLCESYRSLLTPDGSMMINLGRCWMPDRPQQSLYIERFLIGLEDQLGLSLCQFLGWHSKNKLSSPMEYVAVRRIRVKSSVEPILWIAPDPAKAQANNRNVLREYSASGRRAIARSRVDAKRRPCGARFGPTSFRDNGGSIPDDLVIASNCASNSAYHRAERAAGRIAHPATAPEKVVEFGIRLATTENTLVFDPFMGSGTTGTVATRLGRRFIGGERSLHYIESARLRFESEGITTRSIS
jgi:site-specific DNA-methyltransferase (cytosine-N4-specific)